MKTPPSQKNRTILIRSGRQFIQTNIKLIDTAKKFILLHTYIFEDDEITAPILNALIDAADRGVSIFILADDFGSSRFSIEMSDILRKHRIQFEFFTPLLKLKNIGRRLHQKVLIIDNKVALVGGINLSKDFNEQEKPWLDYACCVEGEEVHHIYQQTINLYLSHFPTHKTELLSFNEAMHLAEQSTLIKTNTNDFFKNNQSIFKSYIRAIDNASDQIIIMATYFIPGKEILKHLKKASDRGVEIKLIFGKFSDQRLANMAEKYLYEWYLKNNIRIYEWEDSIIHGKLALIDKKWATIGSFNHNYISRYGNLELNLEIFNKNFCKVIQTEFDNVISKSNEVVLNDFELSFKSKILSFLTYYLTNLLSFLSLLMLFKKSHKDQDHLLN